MVKRCVIGRCSNTIDEASMHIWPTQNPGICKKWDAFVKHTRSDWTAGKKGSVICGEHFSITQDFHNYTQWKYGFKSKLNLQSNAVPSILYPTGERKTGNKARILDTQAATAVPTSRDTQPATTRAITPPRQASPAATASASTQAHRGHDATSSSII